MENLGRFVIHMMFWGVIFFISKAISTYDVAAAILAGMSLAWILGTFNGEVFRENKNVDKETTKA